MLFRVLGVYPEIFSPIPKGKVKKFSVTLFLQFRVPVNVYFENEILKSGKNNVTKKYTTLPLDRTLKFPGFVPKT